ncbi:VirB3 family type IV secretion system protein [Rubrivirga sp. S365]|uniref:VirB3 family type IV secretion system protein n=1 Tax=Rubrivirga sp. S365 TaxID=3076080 RepID=UPI0028C652D9|nr:VirB3 family type IV secretion system protein [Rubrivirga sp. S365]MDT7858204.1 VirB3 family type IV secretion system protein [Rubrivirga sp. S365]
MPPPPERLPERPVHQSLVRVPLYAGVDRSFLVLEVTLVVCLVYLLGVSVASVAIVVAVVLGVHPLMKRLSDVDALLPQFAARALMQADAYDPLPPAHTGSRKPARAVPGK